MSDGFRGDVHDLSAGGFRMHALGQLAPNTVVEGTLHVTEALKVKLKAVVRWSRPPSTQGSGLPELGLELVDPPQAYFDALALLFAELR
jgi:hypothetical protein